MRRRLALAAALWTGFAAQAAAGTLNVTVTAEDGVTGLTGVVVDVLNPIDESVVAAAGCTTGAGGACTAAPAAGTYDIRVQPAGYFPSQRLSYVIGASPVSASFALQSTGFEAWRDDFSANGWTATFSATRFSSNGNVLDFGTDLAGAGYQGITKALGATYSKVTYPYLSIRNKFDLHSGAFGSVHFIFDYSGGWNNRVSLVNSGAQPGPWQDRTYSVMNDLSTAFLLDGDLTIAPGSVDHYFDYIIMHSADRGYVAGQVTDAGGAPISAARVQLLEGSAQIGEVLTDAAGNYAIWAATRTAAYTVSASSAGFVTATQASVTLLGRTQTTVNLTLPDPACGTTINALVPTNYATLQAAFDAIPPVISSNVCVHLSGNYSSGVVITGHAYTMPRARIIVDTASASSIQPTLGAIPFDIRTASVTLFGLAINPTGASHTYGVVASSGYLRIDSTMINDPVASIAGVLLSSNSVIVNSTATVSAGGAVALLISGSGNLVSNSSFTFSGSGFGAAVQVSGGTSNIIQQSTMTAAGSAHAAYFTAGAGLNKIVNSAMNSVGGYGLRFDPGCSTNTVAASSITASGSANAAVSIAASSSVLVQTYVSQTGGVPPAVEVLYTSGTVLNQVSASGPLAINVLGSTSTMLVGSRAVGLGSPPAVRVAEGSADFRMSGSTVSAPNTSRGISIEANGGVVAAGIISVAGSLIQGAGTGIYVAAQPAGTQVWLSSNTILPPGGVVGALNIYGIDLESLASGATVYNNNIYWRNLMSFGAASAAYGIYSSGSSGLRIEHNRISDPGMMQGAVNLYGAQFVNSHGVGFRFNDVFFSVPNSANGLTLAGTTSGSDGIQLNHNVFLASAAASVGAFYLSAAATTVIASDYNAYYSSGAAAVYNQQGLVSYVVLGSWRQQTSQDLHSLVGNPRWAGVAPGAEDFHPLSEGGRFANGAWVSDNVTAVTIDGGDPAVGVGVEFGANGGRVNLGSYGATPEASQSYPQTVAGCARVWSVAKYPGSTLPYQPESDTLAAVVGNFIPLQLSTGVCVVVRDSGLYTEKVVLDGFAASPYRIRILGDPALASFPRVQPDNLSSNTTAAFDIRSDSVSLENLRLLPLNAISYAVRSGSSSIVLSTISVETTGFSSDSWTVAAISVSSFSTVRYSTITATNGAAVGLQLTGWGSSVLYSSATSNTQPAISVAGSTNTLLGVYAQATLSQGLYLAASAASNTVTASTIGGGNIGAVAVLGSSNTLDTLRVLSGISIGATGTYNRLSRSTVTAANDGVIVNGGAWNWVQDSYVQGGMNAIRMGPGAQFNQVLRSTALATAVPDSLSGAINLNGASRNTIANVLSSGTFSHGIVIQGGGGFNSIQASTGVAGANFMAGLYVSGSASNTISGSYFTGTWGMNIFANGNTVTSSTGIGSANPGLNLSGSSNTVASCYARGQGTNVGLLINGGGGFNSVDHSTATSDNGPDGMELNNSNYNSVTASYVENKGANPALVVSNGAMGNFVSGSTVTTLGTFGAPAVNLVGASSNTLSGLLVTNQNDGVGIQFTGGSNFNAVQGSTVIGFHSIGDNGPAIKIAQSSGTVLSSVYVQSSTPVWISGSTNTTLGGSVLVSTNPAGFGIRVTGGGSILTIASSTFLGSPDSTDSNIGVGLVNQAFGGSIAITTNTFQGYGTSIWLSSGTNAAVSGTVLIASNTILSPAGGAIGVHLAGLSAGATVENNSIYFRQTGLSGTWQGVWVQSSAGVALRRNRINHPSDPAIGNFGYGIRLEAVSATDVLFNDLNLAIPPSGVLRGISVYNSTAVRVRNNVIQTSGPLCNGCANTLTTAVLEIDLGSIGGFAADYNDYVSPVPSAALWKAGIVSPPTCSLPGWVGAGCPSGLQDVNSISADPLWPGVGAGNEDFHSRSRGGRFLNGAFVADAVTAATIDAGDPAAPFANEPVPNGGRVNLGSYGNTPEASMTAPPPGCDQGYYVGLGQTYPTISAAIGAMNHIPGTVLNNNCVVIEDVGPYNEQVLVNNFQFANPGLRITIMADPRLTSPPVVNPPANSTAAFQILNSSVSLNNISIAPSSLVPYGVQAASDNVRISSVNVQDGGGKIYLAGISIANASSISYSSVTMQGPWNQDNGILLTGSGNAVTYSKASAVGPNNRGMRLTGASWNTISNSSFSSSNGAIGGLSIESGSNNNVVSQTTMTCSGGYGLYIAGSSLNTISQSYMSSPDSRGARIEGGANNNTIAQSTMVTSAASSAGALEVAGNANNITGDFISAPNATGASIQGGASFNTISGSTITSNGNAGILFSGASSNTVGQCYIQGSSAVYVTGSTGTVVNASVLVAANAAGSGLWLGGGSVNLSMSSNTITGGAQGSAVYLDQYNAGLIALSTNTIQAGARWGINVATQSAGTSVWITSNTILPTVTSANNTYGIYLNGLTSGATIQNNGIYYRTPANITTLTYGLYAQSSSGLAIDHNRINQPGMLTAGGYVAAYFNATTNSSLKFNDVNSTGTGLSTAYLLQLANGSTGIQVKDNVFLSSVSLAAVASSATIIVDGTSLAGFVSNYNDLMSTNSLNTGICNGVSTQFSPSWTCNGTQDANSIAVYPYWANPAAGVEDFHPKTQAVNGRYNPATGVFDQTDAVVSLTIDHADPAESVGAEPPPNAALANQGSYGQTNQASLTFTLPPPLSAGPANGAYVGVSTPTIVAIGTAPFRLQLSQNSGFTSVIADTITANAYYVSTNTLSSAATYYWRAAGSGGTVPLPVTSNWSAVSSFVVDIGSPSYSAAQVSTSAAGTWTSLPMAAYLSSNVVTARITVQDAPSGLLVSTALPTGLIGQWHFDEASGVSALDASTNAMTGGFIGSPAPSWAAGYRGGALNFAANDYVNVPYNAVQNLQDLTIELWIKPTMPSLALTGADPSVTFVSKRFSNEAQPYTFHMRNGGTLCLNAHYDTFNNWTDPCSSPVVQLNQWQHIAVTRATAGGVTVITIYYNGVPVYANSASGLGPATANTRDIRIGQDPYFAGFTNEAYLGLMDEIRLFNVARSSTQIFGDYQSDTLGGHYSGAAYNVLYSTNSGQTWAFVSTANVSMTGGNGTISPQTLTVSSLTLVATAGPGAPTNQLAFVTQDMAGNVSTATYVILIDTLTPLTVLTPTYPANASFVSTGTFTFDWIGASTVTIAGLGGGASYYLQVANDSLFTSIAVSISTPAVIASTNASTADGAYASTYTLGTGTYYWRVQTQNGRLGTTGPWSATNRFTIDLASPTAASFISVSSTGGVLGEPQVNNLASGVTAQIAVQDVLSGLAVSTYALAFAGDGHDNPGTTSGFGVMYSTNAGQTWIDGSWSAANGGAAVGAGVAALAGFNGKLYAGDPANGRIYVSADGNSWATTNGGFAVGVNIRGLAPFNGKLYAADQGGGKIYVSADGNSWSTTNGGAPVGAFIISLTAFNGKLYAGDLFSGRVFASADGNSWSSTNSGAPVSGSIFSLTAFNGKLYAADQNAGTIFMSADGNTWSASSGGTPVGSGSYALAVFNGRLYSGDRSGKIYASADGNSWSVVNGAPVVGSTITALAAFNGRLYAADGSNGNIYVSADGNTWSAANGGAAVGARIYALGGFNGKLYAGDYLNGKVYQLAAATATLGGADGTTAPQTLSAAGLSLVQSTSGATCGGVSPCGATNQVIFTASDLAGNVKKAGPFAVLVDVITPTAISTPTYPANASFISTTTFTFDWIGASTVTIAGLGGGASYYLQVANDSAFTSIAVSVSTPAVIASTSVPTADGAYSSTYTLTAGTYYWRVQTLNGRLGTAGPWSAANRFTIDLASPTAAGFASVSSTGGLMGETQFNNLTAGATVQITVQDALSGLAVSSGALPASGDGHDGYSGSAGGFGVVYSTNAGQTWIDGAWTTSNGGAPLDLQVFPLAVFNGKLYAGAQSGGKVYSSADGANWTTSNGGIAVGSSLNGLIVFNGKLYAADYTTGKVFSSADGTNWTTSNGGVALGVNIIPMAVFNGRLFAGDAGAAKIYSSVDGTNWSMSNGGGFLAGFVCLAVFNGKLYAGDQLGNVFSTADGTNWTRSNGGVPVGGNLRGLAVFNGKLYATDYPTGKVFSSADGTSWTTSNGGVALGLHPTALAVFNGRLYAGDEVTGKVYSSADGTNWTTSNGGAAVGQGVRGFAVFNGRLYAGDQNNGKVYQLAPVAASLTGPDATTFASTLTATGLNFVTSTNTTTCGGVGPCGATNQVLFTASDLAGNVKAAGPYAVLVDTTPPPAGCAVVANVRQSGGFNTYSSITNALNSLSPNLTAPTCVVIRDASTYAEQVTVQNFASNNNTLTILPAPGVLGQPVVTGGFVIRNTSVSVQNLIVRPSGPVNYGVFASSAYVTLSSITVDGGVNVSTGVAISSWSAILNSSITAMTGIYTDGTGSLISLSTAQGTRTALYFTGSSNTITQSFFTGYGIGYGGSGQSWALSMVGASYNNFSLSTFTAVGTYGTTILNGYSNGNRFTQVYSGKLALGWSQFNTISRSTIAHTDSALPDNVLIFYGDATNNTVSQSFVLNTSSLGVVIFDDVGVSPKFNLITQSTITTNAPYPAVDLDGGSLNTVSQCYIGNPQGPAVFMEGTSNRNTLSSSTLNAGSWLPGLLLLGSSSNTLSALSFQETGTGTALQFDGGSNGNTLTQSTFVGTGYTAFGLASSSNTISRCLFSDPGWGVFVGTGANYNTISQSTMNGAGYGGLGMLNASYNLITQDVIVSTSGYGAAFNGSNANLVFQSTITGAGSAPALRLQQSSTNTVDSDFIAAGGSGAGLQLDSGSVGNTVSRSTMTGNWHGALVSQSSATTIVNCYAQGPNGVNIAGSTNTVIGASVIVGTSTAGRGLWLNGGSAGLMVSSSSIAGFAQDVLLDPYNGGVINLSTNTLQAGAQYSLAISTQLAGTTVWIASNTILPTILNNNSSWGIYVNGLTSGATFQYNSVYFRNSGGTASSNAWGIQAISAAGLVIDHNRISNPSQMLAGGHVSIDLQNAVGTRITYNDIQNANAATMTSGYLIRAQNGSTGLVARNNVFLASMTVSNSSATILVDAGSQAGFVSDYNDFYSFTALNTGERGGADYALPAAWNAATAQDLHSIALQPRWASVAPLAEDFHPMSAKGRYAGGSFVADSVTAGTIDAGDPADPFGNEAMPNGGRANLGSYGNTAQASQTPPAPAGVAVAAVQASSVTVAWTAVAATNGYRVDAATSSDFTTITASSSTSNGSLTALAPQALAANTSYYFRVAAIWTDLVEYSGAVTTTTLVNAPAAIASPFTNITTGSLTGAWSANGNSAGTTYAVSVSTSATDPLPPSAVQASTQPSGAPSIGLGALAANATYYLWVAAQNRAGSLTSYLSLGSTQTLVNPPLTAVTTFTAVYAGSATVAWNANQNAAGTRYVVSLSTSATDPSAPSSVQVSTEPQGAPGATMTGLLDNTSYFLYVRAIERDGAPTLIVPLGSTITAAQTPTGLLFPGVSSVTLVASAFASGAFSNLGVGVSSVAIAINGVYASWAGTQVATFSALTPNTAYAFKAQARNQVGSVSAESPAVTTFTLAAVPSTATPNILSVWPSSVSVQWTSNGNPGATEYRVEASTASDFSGVLVASPWAIGVSTAVSGLTPNATNYFRVKAHNGNAVETAYTSLGSTVTPVQIPAAPSLSFIGIFQTSMSVSWLANGNPVGITSYTVALTTSAVYPNSNLGNAVLASTLPVGAALSATLSGLSRNTSYYLYVAGIGLSGATGPYAALGATWTAVDAPGFSTPAFLDVEPASVTVQWALGTNPVGTQFEASASTEALFGGPLTSGWTTALSTAIYGLTPNATYYFRVRAVNGVGVGGPYLALGSTTTLLSPISALPLEGISPFAITAAWSSMNYGGVPQGWSDLAALPAAVQGNASAIHAGRLYVSGGSTGSGASSTVSVSVIGPDGTLGAWANTTPLPANRDSHAMAAWGGRLYVAGGSDGVVQPTVWSAAILSDGTLGAWAPMTPLPGPRVKFTLTASLGWLYAIGGDNGVSAQSTVYAARINSDGSVGSWTAATPLPGARSGHAAAAVQGTLFVSGGVTNGVDGSVLAAGVNGGAVGSWTVVAAMPAARTRHAMAASAGRLYVAGGHDGTSPQSTVWSATVAANGTLGGWAQFASLPGPRYLHALSVSGERLYLAGGSDAAAPAANVWSSSFTGTAYLAERAADAGFATRLVGSGWVHGQGYEFAGLTPNTTYYLRVRATSGSVTPPPVLLGSTMTWAAPPGAPISTFTSVDVSSIGVQWTAGANPAGTEFRAQASTAPDFSGNVMSSPWGTPVSTLFTGLAVNTSYYIRAQGHNALGVEGPPTFLGATFTLSSAPVSSTITAVQSNGFTLQWSTGNLPAWTRYEAQASTVSDFSLIAALNVAYSSQTTFAGLPSAATFYARVRSVNGNGTPSVFDLVVSSRTSGDFIPPAVATGTMAYPAGVANAVTASWIAPGNDGAANDLAAGSKFYVQWSSQPPAGVAWSFGAAQLVISTGPLKQGSRVSAVVSGLPAESTVTLRVWTQDDAGNTSPPSSTFAAFSSPFAFTTLDTGNVGQAVSLAVDRFGNLHLAYRGATGELRYLKRSGGTWGAYQNPDPGVAAAEVSLALDNDGNPQIAYRDVGIARIKVARWSGTWSVSVVEAGNFLLGGLALTADGRANLSYHDPAGPRLKFAQWTGLAWATSTVTAGTVAGRLSAIALSAAQVPVIVYTDDTLNVVNASSLTATGWSQFAIDGSPIQTASGPSVAFDGAGTLIAAYPDSAALGLRISSGTPGFGFVGGAPAVGVVGALGAMALDGAGRPFIAFYDASMKALRYLRYQGASIASGTIDAGGDAGGVSAVAIDGAGSVYVAYYDAAAGNLKLAQWTGALVPVAGGNSASNAMAPSGFSGVALNPTQIQWSWTDNAPGETGFRLYGGSSSTGPFSVIASLGPSPGVGQTVTFVESGLVTNTTYYRYAVAVTSGGVAPSKIASAFPFNAVDVGSPTITNSQTGDALWRASNSGLYRVSFSNPGTSLLTKFQVKASTVPGGGGPDLIAYTDAVTAINASTYTQSWALPAAVFNALWEGATNYISVKAFNGVGNSSAAVDAFYVLKDTTPPTLVNGQAGDAALRKFPGTLYNVAVNDFSSRLASFQYSVSVRPGSGDASTIGWTDIALVANSTGYATSWPVAFSNLPSDVTSYISVRAWDLAGSTATLVDAFFVRKDTAGPSIRITVPSNGMLVSSLAQLGGTAYDWAGVGGVEVSIQQSPPAGNYWDGSAFASPTQKFVAAIGTSTWIVPISGLADGAPYQVVARATDTLNNYSGVYATSTFTWDVSPPVVASTGPPNMAVVTAATLRTLAGTAADATSGVGFVEVRLRRNTDGLWWDWTGESWLNVPVSSVATGSTQWTLVPSARLLSFLTSGTSYFIAVRGTDLSAPPNAGSFSTGGSTFTFIDTVAPGAVTDLTASSNTTSGRVVLSWTSPGNDAMIGDILLGTYAVGFSTDSTTTFSTRTAQVVIGTASVVAGSRRGLEVANLVAGTTYFLHLWLADGAGNWSALSNAATMQAGPPLANQIGGHVVKTSSEGITAVQITCYDVNGSVISSTFTVGDGFGSFTLGSVPAGTFRVEAAWSASGITSSVWQDNILQGTSNVEFVLNLNYTLSTLTGTLGALSVASSGRGPASVASFAPKAGGSAYSGAKVELFAGGKRAVEASVNTAGRWTISNLLPGKYGVRAFNGVTYTEIVDVVLGEGELKEVGFVYNPLPEASVFAFPNPARDKTTFRFETPLSPLEAQVLVFDLAGNLVREIAGSEMASSAPGLYHAPWDLRNGAGEPVASGVYLFVVKVKGGSDQQTAKVAKKLAIVK